MHLQPLEAKPLRDTLELSNCLWRSLKAARSGHFQVPFLRFFVTARDGRGTTILHAQISSPKTIGLTIHRLAVAPAPILHHGSCWQ